MPNDKALHDAQIAQWPETVFLSDRQLVERLKQSAKAHHRHSPEERVQAYRRAYPHALSYKVTDCTGECFGMRYGVEGHEYISL